MFIRVLNPYFNKGSTPQHLSPHWCRDTIIEFNELYVMLKCDCCKRFDLLVHAVNKTTREGEIRL